MPKHHVNLPAKANFFVKSEDKFEGKQKFKLEFFSNCSIAYDSH